MSDSSTDGTDESGAARMELGPDAIRETDDEYHIDCPQCGASVSIGQIVNEGRCPGRLEDENVEVQGEDTELEGGCGAELSLELVWEG